eukprot:gnl/TRDRNA2_/TRDRNA2_100445_c2_seq1.p1 gnl/TRDRNA2_/TRDRNA2_100445_c2~~gnl/TRDRNA2_/TRDRNA2_100445_c2_seq1.p1  ORF type:complete len:688 (+),score=122.65 gnl/TRDRNA2_/TRDRNA2_100445_c2_seq1:239-2065(+)
MHALAECPDRVIFTKLAVHAVLQLCWSRMKWVHISELAIQGLVILCLAAWTYAEELPVHVNFGIWSILWAEAASVILTDAYSLCHCKVQLGSNRAIQYIFRSHVFRTFIAFLSLMLTFLTRTESQVMDETSATLHAATALLRWIWILFDLRAFQIIGKRLLPIFKSFGHIHGMLVIMLFCTLGFIHAWCAIDSSAKSGEKVFGILVLLSTGEIDDGLIDGNMVQYLLVMSALVIFVVCVLNLFIAVLGDCYDVEQERMVCTFLNTRAQILNRFFLAPQIKAPSLVCESQRKLSWRMRIGITVIMLAITLSCWGFLLWLVLNRQHWSLSPAVFLVVCIVVVQSFLRGRLSVDAKQHYLWICHEDDFEEAKFMIPEEKDAQESHGRIIRLKKFIHDQTINTRMSVFLNCKKLQATLRREVPVMITKTLRDPDQTYTSEDGLSSCLRAINLGRPSKFQTLAQIRTNGSVDTVEPPLTPRTPREVRQEPDELTLLRNEVVPKQNSLSTPCVNDETVGDMVRQLIDKLAGLESKMKVEVETVKAQVDALRTQMNDQHASHIELKETMDDIRGSLQTLVSMAGGRGGRSRGASRQQSTEKLALADTPGPQDQAE